MANRRCAYFGTTRMAVDFPGQVEKLYIREMLGEGVSKSAKISL